MNYVELLEAYDELKPCPFCAGKVKHPIKKQIGHCTTYQILCHCGLDFQSETEEGVIRRWNRRSNEELNK